MADGFWIRRANDGITATAEALFPENDFGAPDWKDTDLVKRMRAYLDVLPRPQRRLLLLLYVVVELVAPLFVPAFGRFSRMPAERRTEAIRGWRRARFILFRYLGDALKASMTMMYMSHPKVSAYIGEHKSCARPADRAAIAHHPEALKRKHHVDPRQPVESDISPAAESLPPTRDMSGS
jgi:hypothetical protein